SVAIDLLRGASPFETRAARAPQGEDERWSTWRAYVPPHPEGRRRRRLEGEAATTLHRSLARMMKSRRVSPNACDVAPAIGRCATPGNRVPRTCRSGCAPRRPCRDARW